VTIAAHPCPVFSITSSVKNIETWQGHCFEKYKRHEQHPSESGLSQIKNFWYLGVCSAH